MAVLPPSEGDYARCFLCGAGYKPAMNTSAPRVLALGALFFAALVAAPVAVAAPAGANSFRLIAGGASYHFVSTSTRAKLNQNQRTLGIEFQRGRWMVQASVMRDSFGCPSDQVIGGRLFPVTRGQVAVGFFLSAMAAYRCTGFGVVDSTFSAPSPAPDRAGVRNFLARRGYAWDQVIAWQYKCNGRACRWRVNEEGPQGSGGRRFVGGVMPAVYLNVGRRARLEAALLYSPWSHHVVAYVQLSFLVWSSGSHRDSSYQWPNY